MAIGGWQGETVGGHSLLPEARHLLVGAEPAAASRALRFREAVLAQLRVFSRYHFLSGHLRPVSPYLNV